MRKDRSSKGTDKGTGACSITEMRGRSVHITCLGCDGASDLSDIRCFMSVASRLPPGFSGEVVLKGTVDRSYSGPMVEALVSSSEVLDRLEGLCEIARRSDRTIFVKGGRERAILEARSAFTSDPASLLEKGDAIRERLSRKGSESDRSLLEGMEDIIERTELMMRRLNVSSEE